MKRYYMQIAAVIAIVMVACTPIRSHATMRPRRWIPSAQIPDLLFRDDKAAAASKKLCGCLVLFTGCNFFRPKSVS